MGRPYSTELSELDATYAWSVQAEIDGLAHAVSKVAGFPLIAVGSGGSLTSAHFVSLLHTSFTGQIGQVFTPLEAATTAQHLAGISVLICSASGSNPDVLSATESLIKRTPHHLFAITTKQHTPLRRQFAAAEWPECHAFSTPTKKDGFLATNSLLATMVLFTRAYEIWAGVETCLAPTLNSLLHADLSREEFVARLLKQVSPVVSRGTMVVMHDVITKPAAMDVESRLTEAGLLPVQPADFRNFAHGRHHWLARHGKTTSVLAFSEQESEIAKRTLALIPSDIPRHHIRVVGGMRGAINAVCHSIFLAAVAGAEKGLDPGRPHVPPFGRKLYHLRQKAPKSGNFDERMVAAIERKSGVPLTALVLQNALDGWSDHYKSFVARLAAARIAAVVMDYDGTLCSPSRRLDSPSSEIVERLNQLLGAGLIVAVATGRGKSVRKTLCNVIKAANQKRLIVGYHNGAEISVLSDATCPPDDRPFAPELVAVAEALKSSVLVRKSATVEAKGQQITIELLANGNAKQVLSEVSQLTQRTGNRDLSVVTSTHSIDILAQFISKRKVVEDVLARLGPGSGPDSVLCIGDRGCPPGNDSDLLCHPLALSVDEVSADPLTCWNLAAPGLRFDSACFEYLGRLKIGKGDIHFDTKGIDS
jgi:hydroxymethylpyrimidine pyrophosphatase-like HAD family hydrolase